MRARRHLVGHEAAIGQGKELDTQHAHVAERIGQALALFVMTVAAAEIVVGLALLLAIYRGTDTVYAEDFNLLKG